MTSWSGRWTQMKYAKLQLWRTFNLNKTQSLNGALRAVYMEEERGNFVALGGGDEDINTIVTPTAPAAKHTGPITRARARQLNY